MKIVIVCVLGVVLLAGVGWGRYYVIGQSFEVKVRSLHNKIIKGDDKYLVFTDKGVFENVDTWVWLKFDSSEVQNGLDAGECYRIRTRGLRIPVLSWYKNIQSITPIECK